MSTFDPLGSTSSTAAFGGVDEQPPWPTTPHDQSPIPNLRRATPPVSPLKEPTPGLYGKVPQVYGQPEAGLISPRDNVSFNGTRYERPEPYLRVRITGLDRNRRDILVRLDAQTNLSNFTGTTYRNVSRSYLEFQQFYEAIVQSNPQTIVPALPLAQTSAPTDEEDDRLVRIMLQRWITRVCEDPIILYDEDLRSFIESDFGYQPTPRPRRKASSGFSLIRRGVPDEDEELQRARFELTKLEGQFFDTAKAIDKLAIARKSLAGMHSEMGNRLINVATTEAHPPLGNAFRKIGRAWHSLADLDQAQAISECVIIGDSLGYQGLNARSAKETLLMRTGVLEEYQAAVKTTISKRRNIERLKASSNIRPDRVDEAIEDMEEANKYEQVLARRADGISQNLHQALRTHNRYANDDITTALIEHARSSIMYERQLLKELEALRSDVSNANKKVLPSVIVPRPTVVPPLEDFARPPAVSSATITNGHRPSPSQSHLTPSQSLVNGQQSRSATIADRPSNLPAPPLNPHDPLQGAVPSLANSHARTEPPLSASSTTAFISPSGRQTPVSSPPQAPVPAPAPGASSSPAPKAQQNGAPHPQPVPLPTNEPPLGGRFADGTKSMFITPTLRSTQGSLRTSSSATLGTDNGDPLLGNNVLPTVSNGPLSDSNVDPLSSSTVHARSGSTIMNGSSMVDPLGGARMTSSLRVQTPARPRLDARDAARKLANSGF